jgi:hypothetical protein
MREMVLRGYTFRPVLRSVEWPMLFPGNLVGVGFFPLFTGRGLRINAGWRVRVDDADDTEHVRDFDGREEAMRILRAIPFVIGREDLRALGMR